MQRDSLLRRPASAIRAFATRMGHDAVWLVIAAAFCLVEGAVKLTEVIPFLRSRIVTATRRGTALAPQMSAR